MTSLQQREQQLILFLRQALPTLRVSSSLEGLRDQRRSAAPATEVLVALRGFTAGGMIRWHVDFVDTSPAPASQRLGGAAGIHAMLDRLRHALGGSPYADCGGEALLENNGVYTWRQILEERHGGGLRSQVLIRGATQLGALAAGLAAGERSIEGLTLSGDPPEAGDLLLAEDAQGPVSIGAFIYLEEGVLRVASGPPRAMVHPVTLYIGIDAMELPTVGDEESELDVKEFMSTGRTLSGAAVSALFGAGSCKLRLILPHVALVDNLRMSAWLQRTAAQSFLLARSDGSVEEATFLGTGDSRKSGSMSIRIDMRCRAAESLAEWEIEP